MDAGGLDWYGLDIYDCPQFHFPNGGALDISGRLTERLNTWLTVVRAQTGLRYPKLNICETNSAQPSSRAKWFTALGQWLNANGGHRMLTFWSDAGCGPWLPDDTATIEALRALAAL